MARLRTRAVPVEKQRPVEHVGGEGRASDGRGSHEETPHDDAHWSMSTDERGDQCEQPAHRREKPYEVTAGACTVLTLHASKAGGKAEGIP